MKTLVVMNGGGGDLSFHFLGDEDSAKIDKIYAENPVPPMGERQFEELIANVVYPPASFF